MFKIDDLNHEVKHEAEVNDITILKELKLFFMNNKHRDLESQGCLRYNSVLEAHNAILVYVEDEKIHKLFVNDEALEPQSAIETLAAIIESLEALNSQSAGRALKHSSSTASSGNTEIKAHAEKGDVITITAPVTAAGGVLRIGGDDTIINNSVIHQLYVNKPTLDESTLNAKEAQALAQLKAGYSTSQSTLLFKESLGRL